MSEHIDRIIENKRGKSIYHNQCQGIGHSVSMAKRIEAATGIETRATILGYMQRGGAPTCGQYTLRLWVPRL